MLLFYFADFRESTSYTPTDLSGSSNTASVHTEPSVDEKKIGLHTVGIDNPMIVVDDEYVTPNIQEDTSYSYIPTERKTVMISLY